MYYIGVDLGGTHIAVGLVDGDGKIISKDSIPTFRERNYQEIIKDMAMLILKVINEAGLEATDIQGIGIGSPGTPNDKDGILVYANNLNFKNVPLRMEVQKYINLPVYLDNDANCAALAESIAGAAKDVNTSITITLGTGVGSGAVINRKIYNGFNGSAVECGHMVIVQDGELCTCGRNGCWEVYGSATGLIKQARKAAYGDPDSLLYKMVKGELNEINGKIVFDAAREGDETAQRVVMRYIRYVGEGITNVINIFQPEVLVIGGGICNQGEYLLNPLRKIVSENVYCKDVSQTQIRVAQMGNDAGVVGAAMLCTC